MAESKINCFTPNLCATSKIFICAAWSMAQASSLEKNTYVAELKDGGITEYTMNPKDFGINILPLDSLKVSTVEES